VLLIISLSLTGCVIPTAALNTINCDPKNRDDCYSVTEEFLVDHFEMKERQKDCKEEGFRQVRDYQLGNIQAKWECEETAVDPPAGKAL
jgi:hypothetical protein